MDVVPVVVSENQEAFAAGLAEGVDKNAPSVTIDKIDVEGSGSKTYAQIYANDEASADAIMSNLETQANNLLGCGTSCISMWRSRK